MKENLGSRRLLIGAAVLALLVGGVWLSLWDHAAWVIRRQSVRLEQALNKPAGEGPVGVGLRVQTILSFFSRQPVLLPGDPLPGIQSREELRATIGYALMAVKSVRTKVLERELTWIQPRKEARMRLAVEVTTDKGEEQGKLFRAYEVTWVQEDGRWVISRAHVIESIRAPRGSG